MLLDEKHRNYFVPLNRFNIVSSTLSKLTAKHLPWLSCLKKNWLSYIRHCWPTRFIYCFVETACRKTLAIPKLSSWCQSFSTYFSVQTSSNLNNGFGFGFDWDRWWPIWQKDQNNGNKFTECVFPHKNTNKNSWKTYFTAPLLRLILLLCWIESTVLQSFREFREFCWGRWCCFCGCFMSRMPLIRRFQPPTSSLQPSISQTTPQFRMYSLSSPTQVYQGCSSGR